MGTLAMGEGDETTIAKEKLDTGKAALLVFSGKMCSGKDIVAEHLDLPDYPNKKILPYGLILREYLQGNLEAIYAAPRDQLATVIEKEFNYTPQASATFAKLLEPYLDSGQLIDPWERSNYMRKILQLMGSDFLPHESFLPDLIMAKAFTEIDDGTIIILTGGRLYPDIEIPKSHGAIIIRLEVTRETQLRRLKARDGLESTPELTESLEFISEIALDDYPFTHVIHNDYPETKEGLEALLGKVEETITQARKGTKR